MQVTTAQHPSQTTSKQVVAKIAIVPVASIESGKKIISENKEFQRTPIKGFILPLGNIFGTQVFLEKRGVENHPILTIAERLAEKVDDGDFFKFIIKKDKKVVESFLEKSKHIVCC